MARKEYKRWHDNVAKKVDWDLFKKNGLKHKEKWYEHVQEGAVENEEVKVFWDINIQGGNVTEARRPDIIVTDKKEWKGMIIDITVSADVRVEEKNRRKWKSTRTWRDIGRLLKLKMIEVMSVVIGALESVTKEFDKWIEKLGIIYNVGVMQKIALSGTERILRKVLEIQRRDHSVNLWSFVVTRVVEEMTALTTVRIWYQTTDDNNNNNNNKMQRQI